MRTMGHLFVALFWLFTQSDVQAATDAKNYRLSERCSASTNEYFRTYFKVEPGESVVDGSGMTAVRNFTNHSNAKLNKCFLLVTETSITKDDHSYISKYLLDVLDHKLLGAMTDGRSKATIEGSCYVGEALPGVRPRMTSMHRRDRTCPIDLDYPDDCRRGLRDQSSGGEEEDRTPDLRIANEIQSFIISSTYVDFML